MENTNKWKNIAFHYLNVHFHFCILFFWLILGYNFRFTLLCGERKGYPFQYSGLEKSMEYIVHGVAKSWTRLSDFHFTLFLTLHWVAQFSSVAQLCPTFCDPMDCSMLGFPVHHQLPELVQTHVYWVGDAIQPSHPLLACSPPAFNLSQHQGLESWVSSSHQVA